MVIQEAIELFRKHQKGKVKKSTLKSYGKFLEQFWLRFSGHEVTSISAESIGKFLEESTATSAGPPGISAMPRSRRFSIMSSK